MKENKEEEKTGHSFVIDALDSVNLTDELSEEVLTEIGSSLVDSIEADRDSRSSWMAQNEQWMKLATQVVETKTYPWPGAANVKYPLLTTAAIQFHARAYPALVNKKPVKCQVLGSDRTGERRARADRVSAHMSYQVLHSMPSWEEDMDRLCMILPLSGMAFKKLYYSNLEDAPISELVLAQDLIVNYNAKSFEKAPRKTHIQWFHPNEIKEYQMQGLFRDIELGQAPIKAEKHDDATQMKHPGQMDEDEPHEVYECHTWWDLDEDGYKEPYIVTIHRDKKEVLRIVPRFTEDSFTYNEEGDIVKITPLENFTRFIFIPDPNSNIYGLGFGHLLGPTNEAANTIINQLLDAGTLSNLQSGFLAKGIRIKGGSSRFRPGEWKQVASTAEDLAKGIYPLPVREPSNVLFTLLGTLLESGQRLSSITDIMVGENPGQNQPSSTTMAVMEQGMKVFTGIYKRIHRSMSQEYIKLYYLNHLYEDEAIYFMLNDLEERVYPEDYEASDVTVIPSADPDNITDAQKLMRAEALWPLVEMGMVNPQEAARRQLEAQGHTDIDMLMQMPPPQPDPEVVLEQEKFEHQRKLEWAQLESEMIKSLAMAERNRASAIKNIADAQSREEHDALDEYTSYLTELKQEEDTLQSRMKMMIEMAKAEREEKQAQQAEAMQQQSPTGGAGGAPAQTDEVV